MEIERKQLKHVLLWLLDLIYGARREVIAHKTAHTLFRAIDAEGAQMLDEFLERARKGPAPAFLLDHHDARAAVERLLAEEKVDDALEFLKNWKPEGPIQ